jgi:phospholipid/cholesterol/gamma-HCH transport system ATP-binding protein
MEPAESKPPILRFEHVNVSFDGVEALRDLTFEAREGRIARDSGRGRQRQDGAAEDGAGAGAARFRQGLRFRPRHQRHAGAGAVRIRSRIGMLFQESALFDSMSIEDNVAYPLLNQKAIQCPPGEVHARVKQALDFVELGRTLAKFPSELSGGMRRRAAIARAVVTEPPLMLYDSPTAGLDPITAHTIIALLIKERDISQTTTLMVTHRYQDGNLIANFRYNSKQGLWSPPATWMAIAARTTFMVLKEGRLIFEGDQDLLEASQDVYISKFVKPRE